MGAEGLVVESHALLKGEEQKVAKKLGWRADTKRANPLTGVHLASVFRLSLIQRSYVRQCQKPLRAPFCHFWHPVKVRPSQCSRSSPTLPKCQAVPSVATAARTWPISFSASARSSQGRFIISSSNPSS